MMLIYLIFDANDDVESKKMKTTGDVLMTTGNMGSAYALLSIRT